MTVNQIGTGALILIVILLIPISIPIVLVLTFAIAALVFLILYAIGFLVYFTFVSIALQFIKFYAGFAVRVAFLAYIALWTFVGYGVFDSNPVGSVAELWKEFVIWAFLKLSLNSVIPFQAIIDGIKTQWVEAEVFDLNNERDNMWLFLILWPIVFTLSSQFGLEFYIISPLLLGIYMLNQDLFI